MDDFDAAIGEVLAVALFFGGIIFAVLAWYLWMLVCWLAAVIVYWYQRQEKIREAKEEFDWIVQELGASLPGDAICQAMYEAGVTPPNSSYRTPYDWYASVPARDDV